jgi:hypothetical protein
MASTDITQENFHGKDTARNPLIIPEENTPQTRKGMDYDGEHARDLRKDARVFECLNYKTSTYVGTSFKLHKEEPYDIRPETVLESIAQCVRKSS